ncbi:MAG: 3-oxoacyl-ACP reductase FabG [Dehalococcoidia bacterium]|jgi:NAD(P)-dependent dehydrogenase (short-subunit alcohol dehydrogenase family)|nr:3-oxoacyl-ACP reductase FabG [Dehalococcoidia bacterium]MDW8008118.1 3-oxoacyl-ACP reductase family protein [Chloroflexota bacterium]
MDMGISGRVALVTGAGRGIGRAICLALAAEGARVAVNDIFEERAARVAEAIRNGGGTAIAVAADVTDQAQVEAMVRHIEEALGPVEILVNNAGVPVPLEGTDPAMELPFAQSDRPHWDRIMNLNTYGTLYCTRAVLPRMIERRWGRIVNITSDAGRVGAPNLAPYSMAKAGIIGFSKALAREVGRYCITVNCVAPGATETEGAQDWLKTHRERIMPLYPMALGLGRLGLPEDIANAVVFFASERAVWITGQVLSVNGGSSMSD